MNATSRLALWARERRAEDRDGVIEEYGYLCKRAARKFLRRGVDRADLEQVAAIGLIKAVDRYDGRADAPFEAYAWVLVLGELMHHVRDAERLVRAPRRLRELERRWLTAERELWVLLGREPSESDIARYVNVGERERAELREYRARAYGLPLESPRVRSSSVADDEISLAVDRLTIQAAVARLSELERRILRALYIENIPIGELAARIGYSRRHLTRLHRSALARLATIARPER